MKKILAVFTMLMFCLSCSSSSYKYINDEQVYNNIITKTKDGIVVYGTTWCPNCKQYIEQLKEIKDDLRGEVDIYLIEFPYAPSDGEFLDYEKETYEFLKKSNYPFEIYIDKDGIVFNKFKIKSVPSIGYIKDSKLINNIEPRKFDKEELLKLFGK